MKLNDTLKKWLLLAGYLICAILLALIHEPWMDELHAWVMARDLSVVELWSSMREEGHFCLWYLILMPFAKAGLSVPWLQTIGITLMIVAGWLLVFKTEFSYLAKVTVLLSFPMIYTFPVIVRCYALIPPILFLIALVYRKLNEKKYLYAVLVGLLAHTHIYMEGMVLALFLVYIHDMILPKYRRKSLRMKDFYPPFVIVIFVLLAFLQVARNPFEPVYYYLGDTKMIPEVIKGLKPTVSDLFKGYSILPFGLADTGLKEILVYTIAFIPMALLSCVLLFNFSNSGRLIAIMSIGWQVLISIFVFSFRVQRVYLPFIIILTIIIMEEKCAEKSINGMVVCLCVLASISGYSYHLVKDISMSYASFKPLAEAIEKYVPKSEPVFSIEFGGDSVTAYFSDRDKLFIPMPLDSIKLDSFYVISDRPEFKGFEADYIYDGSDSFKNHFSLVKLRRLNNE